MNKLVRLFLFINGIILLVYATAFLIIPAALGKIVGFVHHSPNTLVEIMAFYGGLEFGLSVFFIWSALNSNRLKPALTVFIFIFLCAGIARLAGIFLYGFDGASQPLVSGIEISFSVFAFLIRLKLNKLDRK